MVGCAFDTAVAQGTGSTDQVLTTIAPETLRLEAPKAFNQMIMGMKFGILFWTAALDSQS